MDTFENVFKGPTRVLQHVPEAAIVIDNGSWQVRAGYATAAQPQLIFDNVVARFRPRKATRALLLIGNDASIEPGARVAARTPFEGNIVCNWDVMENVLDYTFHKLGCEGSQIENPIIITQPPGNPFYAQSQMLELLFDLYGAPRAGFGIDALFSFYQNKHSTGVVLSSGHTATHVIPVCNGKGVLAQSKRLNWGGLQAAEYLLKLCVLKYPNFPLKVTLPQITNIAHQHCYVSEDYAQESMSYLQPANIQEKDRIIQFPCVEAQVHQKSELEIQQQLEKRKKAGKRLQEQQAQSRAQKLADRIEEVAVINNILGSKMHCSIEEYNQHIWDMGYQDEQDLMASLKKIEAMIKRSKKTEDADTQPEYDLLDIADEDLDSDGLKKKRQQKLLKASYEGRQKLKAAKIREQQRLEAEQADNERLRIENREQWIFLQHKERDEIYRMLKSRRKHRAEMSDRKSLASQMRMKSIASLASNDSYSVSKRKRGNDDEFGANDEDWDVYKEISADNDETEELKMIERLEVLEQLLLENDKNFKEHMTYKGQSESRNSIMFAFLHGVAPFDAKNVQQTHQLHLNVERIRVPEAGIFQPSLAGSDQASIIELIANLASLLDFADCRLEMIGNLHICGGNTLWPGFDRRVYQELVHSLPVDTPLAINRAQDTILDAWRGAAKWAINKDWSESGISKADWQEKGAHFLKERGQGDLTC